MLLILPGLIAASLNYMIKEPLNGISTVTGDFVAVTL